MVLALFLLWVVRLRRLCGMLRRKLLREFGWNVVSPELIDTPMYDQTDQAKRAEDFRDMSKGNLTRTRWQKVSCSSSRTTL
jgi:hypothetical protein